MMALLLIFSVLSSCGANIVLRQGHAGQDLDQIPVLCPPRTFYNRKLDDCRPCSACPMDQIITSPCHGIHDTECGPYYDLHHLIVSAANNDDTFISKNVHHGIQNNSDSGSRQNTAGRRQQETDQDTHSTDAQIESLTTEDALLDSASGSAWGLLTSWKSLTLFACSAMVVVAVVLVVGIYCIRRKMLGLSKPYEYDKASPVDV